MYARLHAYIYSVLHLQDLHVTQIQSFYRLIEINFRVFVDFSYACF